MGRECSARSAAAAEGAQDIKNMGKRTYSKEEEAILWENRSITDDGARMRLAARLGRSVNCVNVKIFRMYQEVRCGVRGSDGKALSIRRCVKVVG